ncbi:MAG TPA: response regulator [candidate division Zixibacteria bacterium]|nr:response regulator [candidate division Zixibacteria bacterium]MDD4917253.1 response regulator [candidate division Zixibacteria bacterium]MDM7973455.1 response regulator [candidate division Zixibacteria bacterium]HOD67488.1 response regulator [candidate division Zixibacteria bacterium]HOZ06912.1 response regulator [candidate division Zixibacteria bacterium]
MAKPILIVDDNPNMSSLLSDMLEVFDYPSERAGDGQEALDKLTAQPFSMVITDMRMPNMTGLELVGRIKQMYPKLPVVLISGYAMSELDHLDGPRPDGFLAKPFMMSDVERLINSLL